MIISKLSKEELVELAKKFINEPDETKQDILHHELNKNFSHPDVANLFFYPENYNHRSDYAGISKYDPTPEEVVQIGIDHKPIAL